MLIFSSFRIVAVMNSLHDTLRVGAYMLYKKIKTCLKAVRCGLNICRIACIHNSCAPVFVLWKCRNVNFSCMTKCGQLVLGYSCKAAAMHALSIFHKNLADLTLCNPVVFCDVGAEGGFRNPLNYALTRNHPQLCANSEPTRFFRHVMARWNWEEIGCLIAMAY
jgi:hypothetical protein